AQPPPQRREPDRLAARGQRLVVGGQLGRRVAQPLQRLLGGLPVAGVQRGGYRVEPVRDRVQQRLGGPVGGVERVRRRQQRRHQDADRATGQGVEEPRVRQAGVGRLD